MSIEINTREYEFSHGHKPRGRGHWAFFIGSDELSNVFWVDGSYGEAKQKAIAEARKRHVSLIKVGS